MIGEFAICEHELIRKYMRTDVTSLEKLWCVPGE